MSASAMQVVRAASSLRRSFCRSSLRRHYATESLASSDLKPTTFGQPLFQSHPYLVKPNELTPGISSGEYEARRRRLMDGLPEGSLVVSVAAPIQFMSGNIFYKFRQASDFWYLTGFEEPESAVILEKNSSSRGYRMYFFCNPKDSDKEKWDGARTGFYEAGKIFHADDARSTEEFATHLKSICSASSRIYVDLPASLARRRASRLTPKSVLKLLSNSNEHISTARAEYNAVLDSLTSSSRRPLAPEVAKLRVVKSPAEQRLMRAAADISGRAHAKTMRFTRQGLSEAALGAHLEYLCVLNGAQRMAYVPVVASGANALTIHYTSNNQRVRDGEMVLIDGGCEYNGYASDITRSYPVSGTFSEPQRDLYTAILTAQKALINLCTEAASVSLMDLHRQSCELLRQELTQIGFNLHWPNSSNLERVLYPHLLSHPIGIDLHESSHFDRNAPLEAGMVLTIEPGIYVPPMPIFPKDFHNIGIRIEDEVLIGREHPTVLSVNAPKEIPDVEGACQGLLGLEPY